MGTSTRTDADNKNATKTPETPAYQAFEVQYVGAETWTSSKNIQMLRIHEDRAILSFDPVFEVAAPAPVRANIGETITLPQVSDEVYNHQFAGWKLGNRTCRAGDPYTVTSLDDLTFTAEWTTLDGKYLITVPEGQHMTVVPQEGSNSPVEAGGSYSFTIRVDSGYEKTEDFAVLVNGTEIAADEDGVYTISNIQEQKTITVTGIVKTKMQEEIEASSVVTLYKADGTHGEVMLTANNDAGTYAFDAENHAVTMT